MQKLLESKMKKENQNKKQNENKNETIQMFKQGDYQIEVQWKIR